MNSLKSKVALNTGSARGLGKAIAERYATLGGDIILNYSRDKAAAEETAGNIRAMGVKVVAIQDDVSKVADIERIFTEAKAAFGKIDIVVANAGFEMVETPVVAFTQEQFEWVFLVNSKAS